MYATLIAYLQATLEGVANVKLVFSTPKTKLTAYPAVFFKPDGFENAYETNDENMKTYRFIMLVLVGCTQTTQENIFNTVLPNTVDAIVAAIDGAWNAGTIDGHRAWATVTSADAWEVSEEQDGLVAYAPLSVEIKLLSNN